MEFPDWLLFEVLLRLPVNSVFSCRIISKQWLSIASDPYFIRAYANNSRASASSPPWIILSPFVLGEISCDLNDDPSSNLIIPRVRPPRLCSIRQAHGPYDISGLTVLGVSHGLVLYSSSKLKPLSDNIFGFSVFNPVTGHQVKTAASLRLPKDARRHGWGFLTRVDRDLTLRSYRIVHVMQLWEQLGTVIFNVYYSEVGDWKEFKLGLCNNNNGNNQQLLALQLSAANLNGILYWADMKLGIIAYDPETNPEQMRLTRHPGDGERLCSCLCVAAYGGEELRYYGEYSSTNGFPRFSIWKLDIDPSGDQCWSLEHKIEAACVLASNIQLYIVCFDPFNYDVVYLMDRYGKPFSYDMKSGILDDQCKLIKGDDERFNRCWFLLPSTHLLVVPPWPTQVADKHLLIL